LRGRPECPAIAGRTGGHAGSPLRGGWIFRHCVAYVPSLHDPLTSVREVTGQSFTIIDVPSDVSKQVAAAAITLEPEGGSEQPTMPIYVLGRVG